MQQNHPYSEKNQRDISRRARRAPVLLTAEETAEILGVKPQTLAVWRCAKRYKLPYVKLGRTVRYRLDDVESFIAASVKEAAG
jgi:excisionase family DNA binding protein